MTTTRRKPFQSPRAHSGDVEPLRTIQKAAAELGVHPWALRRAIQAGIVPAYTPFNSRKLVRLSEVVAAINASQIGGNND